MDVGDYYHYNLTIKLGSLLSLPAKFLNRLRRIDDVLSHELDHHPSSIDMPLATYTSLDQASRLSVPPPARSSLAYDIISMPGPLAFVTSGYALGLVVMALLLNRIQHIVVPPQRSMAFVIVRSRRSIFHAIFYTFFPVNLSSTSTRTAFRIPSLFFLFRSLLLLSVITLQVANVFPNGKNDVLQSLSHWAAHKGMDEVCWTLFLAVCLALLIGALTRGLEGPHSMNQSPFNIFGYSMLLHIYSLPMTHSIRTTPSRPDLNALLTLFFPLLQVTMIHVLGIRKKWSRYRLVPTGICSLASLIHFNIVLWTKPTSYPLLNYLPSLLETILLAITILTSLLNATTQILLEGQITRPLFGHAASLAPKWDEDFAIVLLRLGTASLDATNVAGLGNEVGSVAAGMTGELESKSDIVASDSIVELTTGGIKSMTVSRSTGNRGKLLQGFDHEIKTVKAQTNDDSWVYDQATFRELSKYGKSLLQFVKGCFWLLMWVFWYKWKGMVLRGNSISAEAHAPLPRPHAVVTASGQQINRAGEDLYSRFIHGEAVSDDEDEYDPSADVEEFDEDVASDNEKSDSEDSELNQQGAETAGLYADFLIDSAASMPGNPGPVLLAHMTSESDHPLTRRRYGRLVSQPIRNDPFQSRSDWSVFVQDRRHEAEATAAKRSDASVSVEGRMSCVICTSEPREIICWPCRCLALCNDCRENLASRFPASKHTCPCCRRNVEGFSKIFIP